MRKKLECEGLTSYRSAENGGREVGLGCAEERGEDRGNGRRRTLQITGSKLKFRRWPPFAEQSS